MGQTTIEWSDYTFNPVWGCEKVSPGCKFCYADAFDRRLGGKHWGPGSVRRLFGDHHWAEPLKWEAKAKRDGRIYRVFCASMADVFEDHPEWVEPRRRLWDLIEQTPNLIWLLLTKRPENWVKFMPESWCHEVPANVMLGFTVENQEWLERRRDAWLEFARKIGSFRTFLSIEPLLGPINLGGGNLGRYIDWVICGGESGAGARPMHPDWARSLRNQCEMAGVPFLFKQWGEWVPATADYGVHGCMMPETGEKYTWIGGDGKTQNPSWHGLIDPVMAIAKVKKKTAGRILDGIEHNGLPAYWPSNVGLIESDPLKIVA